jgi:hypothetical protein
MITTLTTVTAANFSFLITAIFWINSFFIIDEGKEKYFKSFTKIKKFWFGTNIINRFFVIGTILSITLCFIINLFLQYWYNGGVIKFFDSAVGICTILLVNTVWWIISFLLNKK